MKTSKKTIAAIAVTLLLAAALFVGAGAATVSEGDVAKVVSTDGQETGYTTLAAAIAAVHPGETITMIADSTEAAFTWTMKEGNEYKGTYTIDFAGKSLIITKPATGDIPNQAVRIALQTTNLSGPALNPGDYIVNIKSTSGNGTIKLDQTMEADDLGKFANMINNYVTLTLENMVVDGSAITRHNNPKNKNASGAVDSSGTGNAYGITIPTGSVTLKGTTQILMPNPETTAQVSAAYGLWVINDSGDYAKTSAVTVGEGTVVNGDVRVGYDQGWTDGKNAVVTIATPSSIKGKFVFKNDNTWTGGTAVLSFPDTVSYDAVKAKIDGNDKDKAIFAFDADIDTNGKFTSGTFVTKNISELLAHTANTADITVKLAGDVTLTERLLIEKDLAKDSTLTIDGDGKYSIKTGDSWTGTTEYGLIDVLSTGEGTVKFTNLTVDATSIGGADNGTTYLHGINFCGCSTYLTAKINAELDNVTVQYAGKAGVVVGIDSKDPGTTAVVKVDAKSLITKGNDAGGVNVDSHGKGSVTFTFDDKCEFKEDWKLWSEENAANNATINAPEGWYFLHAWNGNETKKAEYKTYYNEAGLKDITPNTAEATGIAYLATGTSWGITAGTFSTSDGTNAFSVDVKWKGADDKKYVYLTKNLSPGYELKEEDGKKIVIPEKKAPAGPEDDRRIEPENPIPMPSKEPGVESKLTVIEKIPTEVTKVSAVGADNFPTSVSGDIEASILSVNITVYNSTDAEFHDLSKPMTVTFEVKLPETVNTNNLQAYHGEVQGTTINWTPIGKPTVTPIGDGTWTVSITTDKFSPIAIMEVTPAAAPSKSSSSQGSSVWLTEPVQPTAQPTAEPTATPSVQPSVVPIETPTPATPAPFIGILAGLGAAAAVFGLRRK